AQGAKGIRFQNQRGVRTDWQGNAVIPSLTPYQKNSIRIDTTSLPDDVDTDATATTVIPSRSAAVAANFVAHIGYRALLHLTNARGQVIPFGAMVSVDNASILGIVDDTGTVYLAGVPATFPITIQWGKAREQQCHASVVLPEPEHAANLAGILSTQAICKQE
ncbi:fimbria/pilus outer membrane usher protein, partial [Citrobacter cronae]